MQSTTIRRNHKTTVAALRARVCRMTLYTLENQFQGEALSPDRYQTAWDGWFNSASAKLTVSGDKGTIHCHSNRWIEIDFTPAAP